MSLEQQRCSLELLHSLAYICLSVFHFTAQSDQALSYVSGAKETPYGEKGLICKKDLSSKQHQGTMLIYRATLTSVGTQPLGYLESHATQSRKLKGGFLRKSLPPKPASECIGETSRPPCPVPFSSLYRWLSTEHPLTGACPPQKEPSYLTIPTLQPTALGRTP